MKNSKKFIQLLALGPVVLIPLTVFFISSLVINSEKDTYQRAQAQIELDYLETEKSRIRSKVDNMVDLVSYRQSIINQKLHDRIQRRVEDAHRIAITLYNYYVKKMPEAELKKMIIEALRPLVWNNGESFIWILDYKGNFQLAPHYLKHLEGSSILDFEDATGRKIIREEIAIAQTQGHGFLWDTFTKPNESIDKQFKQLAYVKDFGIYNWYLGSSEYLDTAEKQTNSHLIEAINQIGKGESSYFFVLDSEGTMLVNNARPDIVNKNIHDSKNKDLNRLYIKIVKQIDSKKQNFISYFWINPKTGLKENKLAFVEKVPYSNWIIGSGFYPEALKRSFSSRENHIKNQHQQRVRHLQKITWLSMLISLIVSSFISLMFYRGFIRYHDGLIAINDDLNDLNIELEKQVLEKNNKLNKLNLKLDALASKDDLTKTANRSLLMDRIVELMNRANQFDEIFSVLILDVNHFKKVYEDKGYEFGDAVLQDIALLIGSQLRSVDLVGRYDGEEFLVVMPNTLIDDAYLRAQKISQVIEATDFHVDNPLSLTIGVVEYVKGQKFQELIKFLHQALKKAKNSPITNVCKFNE
ncbi:cache domain-containing protein [Thiomicrorhabdus sp.]|uniref:sensor domain-containing diguanylate cyclase n=1 Tax=Thiomicrorhabdus sp. TaxID=2039724 RepID=UPI002AA6D1BD|nr:cache domain-containing protein [Thiomicrorhabdus sp.]